MAEYLELEKVLDDRNIITVQTKEYGSIEVIPVDTITDVPLADVQPVKLCRMIPQKPDCRGYTDTFFCTNCQLYIHLGFIGQSYGGNYCIECGAEVEDGDAE